MKLIIGLLAIGLLLLAAALTYAQTPPILPPAAAYYEQGIFRAAVSLTTPFSVTRLTPELLSCGRLPTEPAPDNAPNPTMMAWTDPADTSKECRVTIGPSVIALPIGVNYRVAVRAVSADGSASAWSFAPQTFRRAPRGLPCPNGLPGVLFQGENDIDGKPVHLTICVSQ